MSKKLNDIRKTIDKLDDQIHDLLMKRASLIVDICEEKRKHDKPVVQPAREAVMIRRLLGRHKGSLPQAAIVGIWRELVGAVCMLQKGLNVHVVSGEGFDHCWDAAKDYFGSVLPMTRSASSLQAISAVREDDANIGVVPWPQDIDSNPWWVTLLNQDSEISRKMYVVCALPYGSKQSVDMIAQKSLVVAKIDYANSGQDRSFIIIEFENDVSRARVQDVFKEQGLELLSISSKDPQTTDGKSVHLVEVDDFIEEDDERLGKIEEAFEDSAARCTLIGGYPVPPVFPKGDTDPVGGIDAYIDADANNISTKKSRG